MVVQYYPRLIPKYDTNENVEKARKEVMVLIDGFRVGLYTHLIFFVSFTVYLFPLQFICFIYSLFVSFTVYLFHLQFICFIYSLFVSFTVYLFPLQSIFI